MPSRFIYINQRQRLKMGKDREIDIVAAGVERHKWIGESKWWEGKKAGKTDVEPLIENGRLLKEEEWELKGMILHYWFFAHDGFTREAIDYMNEKKVLWSTREDLGALLKYLGASVLYQSWLRFLKDCRIGSERLSGNVYLMR